MPNRVLVEGSPQISATTPAQTSIGAAAGVVLLPNSRRKGILIQNTGITTLFFAFGTTDPTTSVYHVALKGCAIANDGTGAIYTDDSWVGEVRAIGSAPGGTCVITEYRSGSPDWNAAGDYGLA